MLRVSKIFNQNVAKFQTFSIQCSVFTERGVNPTNEYLLRSSMNDCLEIVHSEIVDKSVKFVFKTW